MVKYKVKKIGDDFIVMKKRAFAYVMYKTYDKEKFLRWYEDTRYLKGNEFEMSNAIEEEITLSEMKEKRIAFMKKYPFGTKIKIAEVEEFYGGCIGTVNGNDGNILYVKLEYGDIIEVFADGDIFMVVSNFSYANLKNDSLEIIRKFKYGTKVKSDYLVEGVRNSFQNGIVIAHQHDFPSCFKVKFESGNIVDYVRKETMKPL